MKLIEILPINFLLRSPSEQRNIIMSFMSYLKIAPVRVQFKVVSKKADISEYIEKIKEEAEREPDRRVNLLSVWEEKKRLPDVFLWCLNISPITKIQKSERYCFT